MGEFKNNQIRIGRIVGASVGISLPSQGIEGNTFELGEAVSVGKVIEVRDRPSLLRQIGLPEDTPTATVIELFQLTRDVKSPGELAGRITLSSAWASLGKSADLTTVAHELYGLKDHAAAIIKYLAGGG
jgi:hypothetical protein